MKVDEGIVLSKQIYKERDLLTNLLLRNGQILSVVFHGGHGGGKTKRTDEIDLGSMIQLVYKTPKSEQIDLVSSREWVSLWRYRELRHDYSLFQLMVFYLRLVKQFSVAESSLFNLISNALITLEEGALKKDLRINQHAFMVISKLIGNLGVFPQIDRCIFCELEFSSKLIPSMLFIELGGISCRSCEVEKSSGRNFLINYLLLSKLPFLSFQQTFDRGEFKAKEMVSKEDLQLILNYLNFYYPLHQQDLRLFNEIKWTIISR